jgi:hypothetical protein
LGVKFLDHTVGGSKILYSIKQVTAQHGNKAKSPTEQCKKGKDISTYIYLLNTHVGLHVLVAQQVVLARILKCFIAEVIGVRLLESVEH